MLKLNRDNVLKTFLEKVKEAKRLNMKDVKMTMKEMDDLFQVVYELMSEQISQALVSLEEKKEKEITKEIKLPKKRRVIEEIKIEKESEEKPIKNIVPIEQIDYNKMVAENKVDNRTLYTIVEEQPKPQLIKGQQVVEEEPEEEEEDNSLYGGTW